MWSGTRARLLYMRSSQAGSYRGKVMGKGLRVMWAAFGAMPRPGQQARQTQERRWRCRIIWPIAIRCKLRDRLERQKGT